MNTPFITSHSPEVARLIDAIGYTGTSMVRSIDVSVKMDEAVTATVVKYVTDAEMEVLGEMLESGRIKIHVDELHKHNCYRRCKTIEIDANVMEYLLLSGGKFSFSGLPDDTRIINSKFDIYWNTWVFLVESSHFPRTPEGEEFPRELITVTRHDKPESIQQNYVPLKGKQDVTQ